MIIPARESRGPSAEIRLPGRGNQAAGTRKSPRRGDHTTKKAASCHADCSSASLRRDAASFWKHLFAFGEMQLRFGEMQLCLEEAVSFMGKPLFFVV
ncbi:MAG: hypothetical protein K2I44_08220 [Muribaculaceae bacterium]|nr:hypothetical protein [Muribaculaceae bacterium]